MNTDLALSALAGALLTAALLWLYWRKERLEVRGNSAEQESKFRGLEKQLHVKEREFLQEKNEIEIAKTEAQKAARLAGYEEGRLFGQAENERNHLIAITRLQTEFAKQLSEEREQAAVEARDKLRAEYELQSKLFTVKICPYVKITEDKSLFSKKHETISGYQYQLLVNGIPAFAPHVIPERTEIHNEINPELERRLLGVAERAANAAIDLYLGGNVQFARLAPARVERATR